MPMQISRCKMKIARLSSKQEGRHLLFFSFQPSAFGFELSAYFLLFASFFLINAVTIADSSSRETEPVNKTYRRGKTTLELRIFPDKSGLAVKRFNHPYFFDRATLVDILSSIYYIDKDIMLKMAKGEKREKHVFQDDEIRTLAPLIIEAFARATPEQDLLVSSYSGRFLLEDLNNIFTLFMEDNRLNVVFGKIRHRGDVSISPALEARKLKASVEPTQVSESFFWEMALKPGQELKSGYKNWLIIDFKGELFIQETQKRKEEVTKKIKEGFEPVVSPLEERIRKIEKILASNESDANKEQLAKETTQHKPHPDQADEGSGFIRLTDEDEFVDSGSAEGVSNIREKFYALMELLKEDLITANDYEQKKTELLNALLRIDVKISLKELKELMGGGFITGEDFEQWKKKLLDKL